MLALLDTRAPRELLVGLERIGHSICLMPLYSALPSPVAAHPDMLLFFGKDSIITTKEYYAFAKKQLERIAATCQKRIHLTAQAVTDLYPKDVLLNAAPVGSHLFCLPSSTAREILSQYTEDLILPVRQGYTKCSILPVTRQALITQDSSIASIARKSGFEVLEITPGQIRLPGYDTGFIGGAASAMPYRDCKEILFCGELDSHPDGALIREFCISHHKKPIEIKGLPLTDVGTLFLI